MSTLKRVFKKNTHNSIFKALAGFGRSMNRLYENRNHDIHSNGELTIIKKLAKINPSVIIDGGANIGDYSRLVSQFHPNCTIYAFEPVNKTFNKLLNNCSNIANIVPINKGLYKEICRKKINIYTSDQHASIYDVERSIYRPTDSIEIELITGDSFIAEKKMLLVDFLKIDIEGAEYDALLGFENSLHKGLIRAVQFEYGHTNIVTKKLLMDFHLLFEKYGYVVGKIFPLNVEFRKYEFKHEDFIGPNFIAVKETEKELIGLLSN